MSSSGGTTTTTTGPTTAITSVGSSISSTHGGSSTSGTNTSGTHSLLIRQSQRQNGVLTGSWLSWKLCSADATISYGSFAQLIANCLCIYENALTYEKGDHPLSLFYVVGASKLSIAGYYWFRLVTNQNTTFDVQVENSNVRELWLTCLQAGVELSLLPQYETCLSQIQKCEPPPKLPKTTPARTSLFSSSSSSNASTSSMMFCRSCVSELQSQQCCQQQIPLPQFGLEQRQQVCQNCEISQGLYHYILLDNLLQISNEFEHYQIQQCRIICQQILLRSSSQQMQSQQTQQDRDASEQSNTDAHTTPNNSDSSGETTTTTSGSGSGPDGWQRVSTPQQQASWVHVPPTPDSTVSITQFLTSLTSEFVNLSRHSQFLIDTSHDFLQGHIGILEFLENLNQTKQREQTQYKQEAFKMAGRDLGTAMKLLLETTTICFSKRNNKNGTPNPDILKFVLEFLLDLVVQGDDDGEEVEAATGKASLAYFWPQLCHLHLCLLPPGNAQERIIVELFQDFLLTVSCNHSIHLALELTWSHMADLEESMPSVLLRRTKHRREEELMMEATTTYNTPCNPKCRKRRFAVLKFICELESHLFDFPQGWGGGSVALGNTWHPTTHYVELLKSTALSLVLPSPPSQEQSSSPLQQQPYRLTRSVRNNNHHQKRPPDLSPEEEAQRKYQIAQHADYFTCHLNFTRRLSDIAEKLRFTDLSQRAGCLQRELDLLNHSGSLGGDPLNRVRDHLIRVVRVPQNEGHVFRSKERTPVLLLMEVVDEGVAVAADDLAEGEDEEARAIDPELAAAVGVAHDSSGDGADNKEGDTAIDDKGDHEESDTAVDTLDDHGDDKDHTEVATSTNDGAESDREGVERITIENNNVNSHAELPDEKGAAAGENHEEMDSVGASADRPASPSSMQLEGALEGSQVLSPGPKALKRFDSSGEAMVSPTTPKNKVQQIVNTVAQEQLKELILPDVGYRTKAAKEGTVVAAGEGGSTDAVSSPDVPATSSTSPRRNVEDKRSSSRRSSSNADVHEDLGRSSGRKFSSLASITGVTAESKESTNTLAPTGDIRRAVLTTIMMRGLQGNTIAAGTAVSVQRSLQELERKRATELLLSDDELDSDQSPVESGIDFENETTRQKLLSLGISPNLEEAELAARPTEEDEILEAIRLMLIQNRVAQGHLSPADAAKVLQHTSLSPLNASKTNSMEAVESLDLSDHPTIDAGDVDRRLVGCGPLPPAVLQALTLWKCGMVTHAELLELVKKDIEFVKHSVLVDAANVDNLQENSAFWGRFAFGERWAEKKSRIGNSSPEGSTLGWDMMGVIVKSNDDLRQEAFIMQLIELCQEVFQLAGLELWVSPYRILATGRTTGIIECVRNAMSFDALKKRPGYGKGGLREHLQRMTEFTADPGGSFKAAQANFVRSLAAYSLISYFFLIKDRHNGNLLLDTAGHVIHIDFGFVFGVAPGGSFSLEMSTPFKLTEEMLDVMGGLRSPLFSEFVTLFCCGFLALQSYYDTFLTLVEITSRESTFKCFEGRDSEEIVAKLRERFCPDLSKEDTVSFALDLIKQATTSYGTRQYDLFQYLSQGIVA